MKPSLISKIIFFAALVISVVVFVMLFFGGTETKVIGQKSLDAPNFLNFSMMWTYILFAIAAGAVILFFLFLIISQPKKALVTIAIFGGIAIIGVICYFFTSGDLLTLNRPNPDNNPGTLKLSEAALFTMYVLIALNIAGILFTEVRKLIKR